MLVGNINYNYNDKVYKYQVSGVDSSSSLALNITSGNYDAILLMESDTFDDNNTALTERRVDIGLSNVLVQTGNHLENGKKKKHPINTDFFCRLGALIRYAKTHCTKYNEKGYTGLQLASGELEIHPDNDYIIKFPMNEDKILAEVSLYYGDITAISIKTDDMEINLKEDKFSELTLFPRIVDGIKTGIMFNKDYLGFDIAKQVLENVTSSQGMYTCIEDIIKAHPEKELTWLLHKNYTIVTDDNLEEVCNYIRNWNGYVYYDTETTGLNITFKSRLGIDQGDQLVGVVLSVVFGESFFFPTQMKSIPNLCGGDHFYFMEHYMRPILEGKDLVAHNAPFDWKVGYIYDINCNIVHDTLAILRLTLGAERKNFPIDLKNSSKLLLNRDSLELSDLVIDDSWGESDIKFWDLPAELVRLYACADTDNTNGLLGYAEQSDLLNKYNAKKIYEIELAFSYAVAYQEFYGHRIDITNIDKMREDIGRGQVECMKKMIEITGHDFNPNSPKDLKQILYTELGIPEQISRKTGRVTTDKETLTKLAELTDAEDNIKYPFCVLLKQYREYEGVRKIVDKFPEHMTADGYIFSSVYQFGTTTGRVSIKSPNYQSYNDPVKKNVVPRPGFWMFDTDYSSVEYRVLGNMVGNKRIMKSFEDPDFDYHAYQAAHMYNIPYAAVTKKLRKAAKGINFGLPYGMGDESLGVRVFGEASPANTAKAAALRNAYFKGQEDIRDWFEYHRNRGVNEGFTETYFGRRRYYHRQDFSVNAIRRQAGNQVIQGTAADIYKTAVGRVFKRICKEGWLGKVMLTGFIHDELLGEVSNEINPAEFLKVLREEFEVKVTNPDGTPWCPLYMGFGYGMSWYEAKSVELPIKLQWEIVEKYGDIGFSNWDGDGRKFCDTIPDMLRDFEVRDIRNQILEPDSQGKEIKPTLNNQVLSCVKEDAKLYPDALSECIQADFNEINEIGLQTYLSNNEGSICEWLDSHYHIQGLLKDDNGNFIEDFNFKPAKSTQDALTQYCMLHGVDRNDVNLLDIEEYSGDNLQSGEESYFFDNDDSDESEEKLQHIIDTRIDTLGLYLDTDNKRILLKMLPKAYMDFIKSKVNREGEGYQIRFKDCENNMYYECQAWIKSEDVNIIQELYLQYFKSLK